MDELPEFPRSALEALRQPLEDGVVTVSRAKHTFTFPAKFMLVAALNPCPCGYYGDSSKRCLCSAAQVYKYQKRLSGPLLDRIDLHIEVPRLSYEKIASEAKAESSELIRIRVSAARQVQYARLGAAKTNSEMGVVEIRKFCKLGDAENQLLSVATEKYNLSGRSVHRLLKIARTIADLAGSQAITVAHLAESLQYRPKSE
jgi:magnesium chelatase family protein